MVEFRSNRQLKQPPEFSTQLPHLQQNDPSSCDYIKLSENLLKDVYFLNCS